MPLRAVVFRFEERRIQVPTNNKHHTGKHKVEIRVGIFWRHRHIHRGPERYSEHLEQVLALLKIDGATLKLKKYFFFTDKIDYSEHVVRSQRLKIFSHTAYELQHLKGSRTILELRLFLGFCNGF